VTTIGLIGAAVGGVGTVDTWVLISVCRLKDRKEDSGTSQWAFGWTVAA
jgi:hypothetical protein